MMKKYEAPRAVRLSDASTASLTCMDGPFGTVNNCTSGTTVSNTCQAGTSPAF